MFPSQPLEVVQVYNVPGSHVPNCTLKYKYKVVFFSVLCGRDHKERSSNESINADATVLCGRDQK